MRRYAKQIRGLKIRATDGDIGHVADGYFDDRQWTIRYVVADTGGWLSGRQVLISPAALRGVAHQDGALLVDLTRQQVENSPSVATDSPVSRQLEEQLSKYYGWPSYWSPRAGAVDLPPPGEPPPRVTEKVEQARAAATPQPAGDPHLRSIREVTGYHVHASDGAIGHVEDFVVDARQWVIRFVMIDTRNWLPGRKVLVAPNWFTGVDWGQREARTDLTRDAIEKSPPYEPEAEVTEEYAGELHDFYGRPNRWTSASAAPVHW